MLPDEGFDVDIFEEIHTLIFFAKTVDSVGFPFWIPSGSLIMLVYSSCAGGTLFVNHNFKKYCQLSVFVAPIFMMADPHPDVTVTLKRTDGIVHRTPHELTDKDIKMKKEKKMFRNPR